MYTRRVPELPEVETVRRIMERVLVGHRLAEVEVVPDEIVLKGTSHELIAQSLKGLQVEEVGRKGKTWWIRGGDTTLYGHLGMAGWIRELGAPTIRIREHGNAPLDDETGRPRFLKLLLTTEVGKRIAFTDGRRLGRLWLGLPPDLEPKLKETGPDMWLQPWSTSALAKILQSRKAPIKALLLDQKLFCGVGNWIADEVLYHAHIAPARTANSLKKAEIEHLIHAIHQVLEATIAVGADKEQLPETWLFHRRWGDSDFEATADGAPIVRETIGGRTTAWVPKVQK